MYSFLRLEFQNFILYNHVNWPKFLTCLDDRIIRETLPFVFCQNLSLLVLCILLCFILIIFGLFWDHRDVDHEIYLLENSNKNLFKYSIVTELSCATNVTHRKEMGRLFWVEFFDRGWRHIKQVLFLNDENHKLGDVTPLELSSLWFANL